MAKTRRPAVFSVIKAVKANARARLGMPPPGGVMPDRQTKRKHGPVKHKKRVDEVIAAAEREGGR